MAKNMVQFQKGMSLFEFIRQYGSEAKCRAALFELRWPNGFRCPRCDHENYCEIKGRKVFQCNSCHFQTSVTAGTIFHSTNLSLVKWFLAMYLITQCKNGISALELSRFVEVSYNAAWRLKHKLMQVMLERGSDKRLTCRIEVDDSYLGAKRVSGKRGRGAKGKTSFIAAIQTYDSKPHLMKLSQIKGFRLTEIARWSMHHLRPYSTIVSDGLSCFNAVEKAQCIHERHVLGGGQEAVEHPSFKWVNTILGNLKNSLRGTYHGRRKKYIPRYLAEFQYRFNRRYELEKLVPRLAYVGARTPPMPDRLLKLAEKEW
ncbi:MAG: IS1595 family transposase [Desulfobacteraceae bacterium]|nr:IS1595 family transposase [Desulfobacteraceae bacterium]